MSEIRRRSVSHHEREQIEKALEMAGSKRAFGRVMTEIATEYETRAPASNHAAAETLRKMLGGKIDGQVQDLFEEWYVDLAVLAAERITTGEVLSKETLKAREAQAQRKEKQAEEAIRHSGTLEEQVEKYREEALKKQAETRGLRSQIERLQEQLEDAKNAPPEDEEALDLLARIARVPKVTDALQLEAAQLVLRRNVAG